jgi:hypothetical protein|tara:strand:+ start:187 stop:396 length:210 start_codon:yes stop_codon:yes gene_type:complete
MAFEKLVIDTVNNVLGESTVASFTSGTLFVDCSMDEAARIKDRLLDEVFTCADIQVSGPIGPEFAFDFI